MFEYCALNPSPAFTSADFKYDFGKGHLKLHLSAALLSLDMPSRLAVNSVRCAGETDGYLTRDELNLAIADRAILVSSSLNALDTLDARVHFVCDRTHDPNVIRPDALDDRAHSIAEHDLGMATSMRRSRLDGGTDSPPQVGGGAIDELTAYGSAAHTDA